MDLSKLLFVRDEMNLYLVAQGIKPATFFTIEPNQNPGLEDIGTHTEMMINKGCELNSRVTLNKRTIVEFEDYLTKNGLMHYAEDKQFKISKRDSKGHILYKSTVAVRDYFAARTLENLERVVFAQFDNDSEMLGNALGFPERPILCYRKRINDEIINKDFVLVSLAKARHAGIEIPSWLGYISFIPERLDLVNNNVSQSSKAIGEKYQSFVRQNNPELAARLESQFKEIVLPTSWVNTSKGYVLSYNPQGIRK